MSELLFGLIFAHFFADFILQTDRINQLKNSDYEGEQEKGLFMHSLHHFVCYLLVYIFFSFLSEQGSFYVIVTPLLICFTHFFIDILKVYLCHRYKDALFNTIAYVADQVLHIVVIFLILNFATNEISYGAFEIMSFFKTFISTQNSYILLSLKDKLFLLGTLVIITTHFSGYLIGMILKPFVPKYSFRDSKVETKFSGIDKKGFTYVTEITDTTKFYNDNPNGTGKYIGMIERLIIVILMSSKAISAIGFLIALKALTRFKQFDDKHFAEYYLIGSLLSILFGFVISFFSTKILSII